MIRGSNTRSRYGFSRTELWMLLSIVLLSLVILVPVLSRRPFNKVDRAGQAPSEVASVSEPGPGAGPGAVGLVDKETQGLNNLRQIGQALHAYAADHKDRLPPGYHASVTDWSIVVNSYLGAGGETFASSVPLVDVFRDPNATFEQGSLHYSAHPILMPDIKDDPKAATYGVYKLSRLRRPDEVVVVMDGVQDPSNSIKYSAHATAWNLDDGAVWSRPYYDPDDGDNMAPINPGTNIDEAGNAGNIRWRQRGDSMANLLFPDGHAQALSPEQVTKRNIRVDP